MEYFGTDGYFGCQISSKKYEFSYHSKSSPAQFVHTCNIPRGTALYSVRHIFEDRSKNLRATTNMDVLLTDADDLIELITILFFTPGGEFYLEDEVFHDVEEEEQATCGLGRLSAREGTES